MAKLVTYLNPLDPLARETKEVEATTVYELIEKMDYDRTIYDIAIQKNQHIIEGDTTIEDGDIIGIVLVPQGGGGGGKNILATVAMIAVMVAAPALAPALLSGIGQFAVISYGATSLALATSAIALAGGMLVNALLPPPTPNLGVNTNLDNLKQSATYSWSTIGNSTEEGKPVPQLFGKHRVVPPLIGQYVETVDNKQYLNLLYAVANGETAIDATSIQINDENVSTYNNVEIYTRSGTNDQSIIGTFGDTISDKSINKTVTSTDWVYATTTGNSVGGITVGLVAPSGLWYVNDSGSIGTNSVKIQVELYRDSVWQPLATTILTSITVQGYWIKNSTNLYYKFALLYQAQEWIRNGTGVYPIDTSSTLPSNVAVYTTMGIPYFGVWQEYTENETLLSYDTLSGSEQTPLRFSYSADGLPFAEYQVRVKFYTEPTTGSRYGSGITLEYLQERITDDFIYPNTALLAIRALATDQLSGGMPRVSVIAENSFTNPSLAVQEVFRIMGITLSSTEQSSFDDWETFCDDNNYTCNIYMDSKITLRRALDMISILGRANVIQFGSQWSVIVDKPDEFPVQGLIFTMGSILTDSYSNTLLSLQDRANTLEITYWDEDLDYEPQTVEVQNEDYDIIIDQNPTQLSLPGCTSRDMAIKYAKYSLNKTKYLTQTTSFEVNIKAIVSKVGDIIKIAHDVPGIGIGSGRIKTVNTISSQVIDFITYYEVEVVLYETLIFDADIYYIEIQYGDTDTSIILDISNTNETTDTIQITTLVEKIPNVDDEYTVGTANRTSKLFRVLDISQTSEYKASITALEYIPEVYDDEATVEAFGSSDFPFTGLSIYENLVLKNKIIEVDLTLTWRGTSLYYDVFIDNEFHSRVYETTALIENVNSDTTYNIKIVNANNKTIEEDIYVAGKLAPPPAVENLAYESGINNWKLSWIYPTPPLDFDEFVVYNNGVIIGSTKALSIEIPVTSKNSSYAVYAKDTSGILSEVKNVITSLSTLADVQGLTNIYDKNGKTLMAWNRVVDERSPIGYEIRKGSSWNNAQIVSRTFETSYTPQSSGTYLIKATYTNANEFILYSDNASILVIDGANLVKNVIENIDEAPTWSGTKDNVAVFTTPSYSNCLALAPTETELISDITLLSQVPLIGYIGGCELSGTYTSDQTVTLLSSQRCSIVLEYNLIGYNLTDLISQWGLISAIPILGGDISDIISITPQIQIDGGSWTNFLNGDYIGQTFKFRFLLATTDKNIIPAICSFNYKIDMPDRIEQDTSITIVDTGATVSYTTEFNALPNLQVTILNATAGDDAVITNETTTGFDVIIKNSGVGVQRNINWIAQGY